MDELLSRWDYKEMMDRCGQGRLSLSTVGDKCAKDNFGGNFIKSLTNFSNQKSI